MRYVAFGEKIKGNTHVLNKQPCQDSFRITSEGKNLIVAVADGHGSAKCKFSKHGADMAVNTFCEFFKALLLKFAENPEDLHSYLSRHRWDVIPKALVQDWRGRVKKFNNFTNEELNYSYYGTTLLGLVITERYYFALQIGDGDILNVDSKGRPLHVIDPPRLLGTETHSLSTAEAWRDIQTEIRFVGDSKEYPQLFILSTDGLSNSFLDREGFLISGVDYLNLLKEHGQEKIKGNLKSWLEETSKQGSGDDIALVLVHSIFDLPVVKQDGQV